MRATLQLISLVLVGLVLIGLVLSGCTTLPLEVEVDATACTCQPGPLDFFLLHPTDGCALAAASSFGLGGTRSLTAEGEVSGQLAMVLGYDSSSAEAGCICCYGLTVLGGEASSSSLRLTATATCEVPSSALVEVGLHDLPVPPERCR